MKNLVYILIIVVFTSCTAKFPEGFYRKKLYGQVGGRTSYSLKNNRFKFIDFHGGNIGEGNGSYKIENNKIVLNYDTLTYSYVIPNMDEKIIQNKKDTLIFKINMVEGYEYSKKRNN